VRGDAYAHLPLNLTAFEEGSVIGKPIRLYRCVKDGLHTVVKSFDLLPFEAGEVEMEMEHLSNLGHPLIMGPIGFAFGLAEGN
jgi:hypothetical protein